MIAGERIALIGADDEQRRIPEPVSGETQQVDRRLVRPVQIVQKYDHRLLRGDPLETPANGLDEDRRITALRGAAHLREQQVQIGGKWVGPMQTVRVHPSEHSEHCGDRSVGLRARQRWRPDQR